MPEKEQYDKGFFVVDGAPGVGENMVMSQAFL